MRTAELSAFETNIPDLKGFLSTPLLLAYRIDGTFAEGPIHWGLEHWVGKV